MHFRKYIKTAAVSLALMMLLCNMEIAAETVTTPDTTEEATTEAVTEAPTTEEVTTEEKTEAPTTEASTEKKTTEEKKQESTTEVKKKKKKKTTEIQQDEVKEIEKSYAEEEQLSVKIIPKIYNDHSLSMKNKREMINGFVYFNQGDAAWNDNGYQIKRAGCGPTSMAVVITSLTGKWVTPVDTTVWAYEHGYYSSAGSSHALIPALAREYGLECKGVGTNATEIRSALQAGNPVVCLMGPGYFTRGGHFMVLVGIDNNDNVVVADVGSRERSKYKYRLTDIIAQSKAASAGGPFWIISTGDVEEEETSGVNEKSYSAKKLSYVPLKSTDLQSLKYMIQSGNPVMMQSDEGIMMGEEFLYILTVDQNGMATIANRDMNKQTQMSLVEVMKHTKKDSIMYSYWAVYGNTDYFMMPVAQEK